MKHSHETRKNETPSAPRSEHGVLPLAPVEKPRGLAARLLFAVSRRRFGRVPTAFAVVYARAPLLALASMTVLWVSNRLRVGGPLVLLLRFAIASRDGCTFCADLSLAEAIRARVGRERFRSLEAFEHAECYSERERAAIAYALAFQESPRIPDAVFERLRGAFDEREMIEIVWVCASERFLGGLALPLRVGSDAFVSSAAELALTRSEGSAAAQS